MRENRKEIDLELEDFVPLLEGKETDKILTGILIFPADNIIKAKFVCGVNISKNIVVFLQMSNADFSGTLGMILARDDQIDPLHAYRLMKLIERLPAIDIEQMLYLVNLPLQWEYSKPDVKKKISKEIGLEESDIQKIMEEIPFDLEEIIWTFRQQGIEIETYLIQKAALNGQIKNSSFFKDLGIKTVEEIAEKDKEKTEIMKKYKKYLDAYFLKESNYRISNRSIMDSLFTSFVIEAIELGAKDDSLIVGYALYSIEKWRIDNITDIVNIQAQGIDPTIISMVERNHRIKLYKNVISFLKKSFSKEISEEEYIASIVNLRKCKI